MATPTLVQHVVTPNILGPDDHVSITKLVISLPNPTLAGNVIIVSVQSDTGGNPTCADDQGQSYTGILNTGSGNACKLFYFLNTVAGVKKITATWSSAIGWVQGAAAEFYNVATTAADVTSIIGSGTSTAWQATGTIAGNASAGTPYLVYQAAFSSSITAQTSFSAQSGFDLGCAILQGRPIGYGSLPVATQYGVVTAGVTNPAITASTSVLYNSIAVAFKSASAGTAPTATPRVVHVQYCEYEVASPVTFQTPCTGGLLVACCAGNTGTRKTIVTGITDGNNNDWAEIDNSPVDYLTAGNHQIWYAPYAITSTTMSGPTVTYTGNITGSMICFMDIFGANSYVAGSGQNATGQKGTTGDLTTVTVTPTAVGQIVIAHVDHAEGTEIDCVTDGNAHTPYFMTPYWWVGATLEDGTALSFFCHDTGQANFRTNDTQAVTFIWSRSATPPGDWAALAGIFAQDQAGPAMNTQWSGVIQRV